LVISLVLPVALAAACSETSDLATSSTTSAAPTTTQIPSGKLVGLQGTTPRSVGTAYFQDRLAEVAPHLVDPSYAAEAYDSVVVLALAAESAKSDAPGRFVTEVINVTRVGEKCKVWVLCERLLRAGGDPDYDGASGDIDMLDTGTAGIGSFAVMRFDENDQLVNEGIKSAQAAPPATPLQVPVIDPTLGPPPDGQLRIGMLLPTTGSEATLGEAERAGVRAAVKEINDAGGVLGRPIDLIDGDESKNLQSEVSQLLAKGVDAIIGPASSDDVEPILDQVTSTGVVLISPSATASSLTSLVDRGRFFQMAPSDALQGQVLADVAAGDGITNVIVLAQKGTYGQAAAFDFAKAFADKGGSVSSVITFDPTSLDPTVVNAVLASTAGGIVVFGDDQPVGALITSLSTSGKGPSQVPFYMGNISQDLAQYVH
jgi:ABC-type branched-subunit amino acid transport system substrate-binding protein